MSAVTPGPWRVVSPGNDPNAFDVVNATGGRVAKLPWCCKPDAALIAAAPEMLAVLTTLRDEWFEPHYGQNDIGMAALLRDQIRAVIAKAEGR